MNLERRNSIKNTVNKAARKAVLAGVITAPFIGGINSAHAINIPTPIPNLIYESNPIAGNPPPSQCPTTNTENSPVSGQVSTRYEGLGRVDVPFTFGNSDPGYNWSTDENGRSKATLLERCSDGSTLRRIVTVLENGARLYSAEPETPENKTSAQKITDFIKDHEGAKYSLLENSTLYITGRGIGEDLAKLSPETFWGDPDADGQTNWIAILSYPGRIESDPKKIEDIKNLSDLFNKYKGYTNEETKVNFVITFSKNENGDGYVAKVIRQSLRGNNVSEEEVGTHLISTLTF